MEIKISKEIRQHRENIFFGLTMRQALCSVLAVGLAVGAYFLLRNVVGERVASWACIVAAAPMAVAGFFSYNGMTFEQFIWALVKTELLCGRPRSFEAKNLYETLLVTPEKQKKRGGQPRV